jgi:hypothetical protein
MIIRPPQQGHGERWSGAAPASRLVLSRATEGSIGGTGAAIGPGTRDIGFAAGAGEQPVMADVMEPFGQDVQQEAPNELVGRQHHGAVSRLPVMTVVLVAEADAALIEGDEPAVGDGDAVGVTGEIGEHRLGPGEGRLTIDEPVLASAARDGR